MIVGPVVGVLVVLVVVLIVTKSSGDGGGGTQPGQTDPGKTQQTAAERARVEEERRRKLQEEEELRKARLLMDLNRRAATCKTAGEFNDLAREAAKNDLESAADGFYAKALTLEKDNVVAHRGLGHTKFDCSRYLEDFDMLDFGGIDSELAEYRELEGQWLPQQRFDEVVAQWEKSRADLVALTEERENDPFEMKVQTYEKRMKNKPFFDDIARTKAYAIGRGPKPVALFIQESLDRKEDHAEEIERRYTPPLKALEKHVKTEIFDRLGLEKNEGFSAYLVWVLNSHGSYDNYYRIGKDNYGLSDSQWAHYNFQNKLAVTYLETRSGYEMQVMHALLHEMVHYYQDAYAPYGIRGMTSFWVVEGMAEWVSTLGGGTKLPDGPFYFQGKNPGRIHEFLVMIERLDGDWPIPLMALVDIPNAPMLISAIEAAISDDERIAAIGNNAAIRSTLTSWTYGFGYCLCRYLYAEREEQFMKYLAIDFEGDGGLDAFKETFNLKDGDFAQWETDLVEYFKK
jgi:hypothetical protein